MTEFQGLQHITESREIYRLNLQHKDKGNNK